jgi:hypothetical protein
MFARTTAGRKGRAALPEWRRAPALAAGAVIVLAGLAFATDLRAQNSKVPPVIVGSVVQITGESPFGDCTADDVPGQQAGGSIVYPDSEVEPYIDVSPTDPDNLVAVWQQDRWNDGGARGLVSAVSDDGGASWETVPAPAFSLCSGGVFERASDPWVTYAADGGIYFMSLSVNVDPDPFTGEDAMLVSKSTDGGHSWGAPVALIDDVDPNVLNDKNSMTADPTAALRAFATWDRLELFSSSAEQRAALAAAIGRDRDKVILAGRALRAMRTAAAAAAQDPPQSKGPTYFARTINGGTSWQLPFIIFDPGPDNQTINNLIEVQPDGTVVVFFSELLVQRDGSLRVNIALKRSVDHGFSFLPVNGRTMAQRLFTLAIDNPVGTFTPDDREGVRDAGLLFDTAVDPHNGNLYLVWQDSRFSHGVIDEIAFSMSKDSGRHWTRPVKINKTPKLSNQFREAAFVPTIAVNADGILAVTYYDFRNDDDSGELTDQFALFCNSASSNCARPNNWGQEQRLTDDSFDILDAPVAPAARGHFLGDYMGSESVTADVHPAYGVPVGADETNIVTRTLTIAPLVASAATD